MAGGLLITLARAEPAVVHGVTLSIDVCANWTRMTCLVHMDDYFDFTAMPRKSIAPLNGTVMFETLLSNAKIVFSWQMGSRCPGLSTISSAICEYALLRAAGSTSDAPTFAKSCRLSVVPGER